MTTYFLIGTLFVMGAWKDDPDDRWYYILLVLLIWPLILGIYIRKLDEVISKKDSHVA